MNLFAALSTGKPLRRPIIKHIGSNRSGWLSREYLIAVLVSPMDGIAWRGYHTPPLITETDLLADDWETKE